MKYKYDLEYTYSTGTVTMHVPENLNINDYAFDFNEHITNCYCDYFTTNGREYMDKSSKMLSPDETCLLGLYGPITIREIYSRMKEEPSSFYVSGECFTLKKVNTYKDEDKDSYMLFHGDPRTSLKDQKYMQDKFDDVFKEIFNLKK